MRAMRFSNVVLVYLAAVLLLGGASAAGLASNVLLEIAGAVLLGWCIAVPDPVHHRAPSGLRPFAAALAVLALIQLLPLPPFVWSHLPGRAGIANGFVLLGEPLPWLPVSLSPWSTVAAFVWWIPALALLAAMLRADAPAPSAVARVVVVTAVAAVAVGAVQRAGGGLYFYEITNFGLGTGFFANANHQAAFLLAALALAGAEHASQRFRQRPERRRISDALFAGVALLLVIGVLLSNSLAGIGLLAPVLAGIALMFVPGMKLTRGAGLAGLGIAAAALVAALLYGWLGGNVAHDTAGSAERLQYLARGLPIVRDMAPFGSGLGTFAHVYDWYESAATVENVFVNHAHDDLLELLIEAGIPGLFVLIVFVRWWLPRCLAVWREHRDNPYMLAATLFTGSMLAHSLVDYPLRTAALSGLFAAGCAMMVRARRAAQTRPRRERSKVSEMVPI